MKLAGLLVPTLLVVLLCGWTNPAAGDWPLFGASDNPEKKATAGSRPAFEGKPMHAIIPAQPKQEPSLLERMNQGTKDFFAGARDLFTFRKADAKKSTATRSNAHGQSQGSRAKKPGFFGSLFGGEEKPKETSTPQEWLAQERPKMF